MVKQCQVLLITACLFVGMNVSANDKRSIQDLDWLIGDWVYEDASVSGTYRDTGTRSCRYTLADKYIVCESHSSSESEHQRSYLFYFNYNQSDKRFEMVSMNNDYPRKNLYVFVVDKSGHHLKVSNSAWTAEGMDENNAATITYDGTGQYVWEIRSGEPDEETGIVPVTFVDTVTRVSTSP